MLRLGLISILVLMLSSARMVYSEIIITNQHVDLTMQWNGSTWNSFLNVDDFGVVALQEAVIRLPSIAANPRPASGQFDFLGTPPGNTVWALPEIQNPQLAWLGIATQSTGLSAPVRITLASVQGPGNVSLWNNGPFGEPVVHWAGFDGLSSSDQVNVATNTHGHYNWGFTAPGEYLLTLNVDATRTNGQNTPTGTFQVRFQAVPEPTSFTVLAAASILGAVYRGRRLLTGRP